MAAKLNQILHGDCLDVLATLPDAHAQLIYLDPPYNTGTTRRTKHATFDDHFGSTANYIAFLRPRVEQMYRVLDEHGSLFLHCDWRASHHVKLLLDDVFRVSERKLKTHASGKFVNEIIWHYGLGAARARNHLLTKHDVIFWYARSHDYTFNLLRSDPTPAMLAKYCHTDEHGRRYMMSYGRKYFLKGGKPLDDVWNVPTIAPTADERTGYPTQKPLALLTRIVQIASREGDTVLDPFCGSGTTLVAAHNLGRNYIGIDASADAVRIAQNRIGMV